MVLEEDTNEFLKHRREGPSFREPRQEGEGEENEVKESGNTTTGTPD